MDAEPRDARARRAHTREAGRTWPRSIREAAERMAIEDGLTAPTIADRLRLDHGADVPTSTVGGWLQGAKRPKPTGDLSTDLRSLANRAIRLCEAEMTAIEQHGRRPIDVDRLAKLTTLLRRLDEMQAAKLKPQKQNGLAKLGQGPTGLEALLSEAEGGSEAETPKAFGSEASLPKEI